MTEKSFDYFYQIISNDAVSFNLYSADSSVYAQSVAPGDKLGFRFMATAPFDEISVTCPSWGHSDSGLRLNPVSYTHLDVYKRQMFYFQSLSTPFTYNYS